MSVELTPEIEKIIEERVKEKEKEMEERFNNFFFSKIGNIYQSHEGTLRGRSLRSYKGDEH